MSTSDFASNSRDLVLLEKYVDSMIQDRIEKHLLAPGKLGGKTLGLLMAWEILKQELPDLTGKSIHIPISYFIGSDEFVRFIAQKKVSDQINNTGDAAPGELEKNFAEAPLSDDLMKNIRIMLEDLGEIPIIVRSSSILEDRYGASFAGIYRSIFCLNQGSEAERLQQIAMAVKQVYASAFSINAASYRKQKGLELITEEMAILIQVVEGRIYDELYFPVVSGIAFSENPYCWTDRLDPKDGFLRMVWGLGTQAVQTSPGNYPRLIGLTNPRLRPEQTASDLFHYSQHNFDALNLNNGTLETLPVLSFLNKAYPGVSSVASILGPDGLQHVRSRLDSQDQLVITFDQMIEQTRLIEIMTRGLNVLADKIGGLINIEFSVDMNSDDTIDIGLLQCRKLAWETANEGPGQEPDEAEVILRTRRFLYAGEKHDIEYVVFIDPDVYNRNLSSQQQQEVAAIIGTLNQKIGEKGYLLAGPGRWGSVRPDLGVPVKFSDISHAKALLEIHQSQEDLFSATYGTHFFLDLVESKIALLAIDGDDVDGKNNLDFFRSPDNLIEQFVKDMTWNRDVIRVFQVPSSRKINIIASPLQRVAFMFLGE